MASISELVGSSTSLTFEVTAADTAEALLSGDVAVLATPRLVAWIEAASVAALRDRLPKGFTSVGTRVNVDHLAASPVGASVVVHAEVVAGTGRSVEFRVRAEHWSGRSDRRNVLRGSVTRAIVDRQRFMAGVAAAARA